AELHESGFIRQPLRVFGGRRYRNRMNRGSPIWIFNPFDDVPGEGKPQRYWRVAEELARRGHEVVWWSSDFSHRRKDRRKAPDGAEIPFAIRLVATPPYQRNISLARIRNHR